MLHGIVVEPVKDEERFQSVMETQSLDRECPRQTRAVKKLEQKGREEEAIAPCGFCRLGARPAPRPKKPPVALRRQRPPEGRGTVQATCKSAKNRSRRFKASRRPSQRAAPSSIVVRRPSVPNAPSQGTPLGGNWLSHASKRGRIVYPGEARQPDLRTDPEGQPHGCAAATVAPPRSGSAVAQAAPAVSAASAA